MNVAKVKQEDKSVKEKIIYAIVAICITAISFCEIYNYKSLKERIEKIEDSLMFKQRIDKAFEDRDNHVAKEDTYGTTS